MKNDVVKISGNIIKIGKIKNLKNGKKVMELRLADARGLHVVRVFAKAKLKMCKSLIKGSKVTIFGEKIYTRFSKYQNKKKSPFIKLIKINHLNIAY